MQIPLHACTHDGCSYVFYEIQSLFISIKKQLSCSLHILYDLILVTIIGYNIKFYSLIIYIFFSGGHNCNKNKFFNNKDY